MIEKLLKLLVAEIDTELFEAVVLKDLEASDIENANKANPITK